MGAVKRVTPEETPEERAAWLALERDVIGPAVRTLRDLRRAGVPSEALTLADDLLYWIRAARVLQVLRKHEAQLSRLDYTSEALATATRREIAACEEILGPRWRPGVYRDLKRDPRFGDLIVRIYDCIKPHVTMTPQRQPTKRRGKPVRYNRGAAKLTARLVTFTCTKALGSRITERDVLIRIQRRPV